jgi:hypothetical protein
MMSLWKEEVEEIFRKCVEACEVDGIRADFCGVTDIMTCGRTLRMLDLRGSDLGVHQSLLLGASLPALHALEVLDVRDNPRYVLSQSALTATC